MAVTGVTPGFLLTAWSAKDPAQGGQGQGWGKGGDRAREETWLRPKHDERCVLGQEPVEPLTGHLVMGEDTRDE